MVDSESCTMSQRTNIKCQTDCELALCHFLATVSWSTASFSISTLGPHLCFVPIIFFLVCLCHDPLISASPSTSTASQAPVANGRPRDRQDPMRRQNHPPRQPHNHRPSKRKIPTIAPRLPKRSSKHSVNTSWKPVLRIPSSKTAL